MTDGVGQHDSIGVVANGPIEMMIGDGDARIKNGIIRQILGRSKLGKECRQTIAVDIRSPAAILQLRAAMEKT